MPSSPWVSCCSKVNMETLQKTEFGPVNQLSCLFQWTVMNSIAWNNNTAIHLLHQCIWKTIHFQVVCTEIIASLILGLRAPPSFSLHLNVTSGSCNWHFLAVTLPLTFSKKCAEDMLLHKTASLQRIKALQLVTGKHDSLQLGLEQYPKVEMLR